MSSNGLLSYQSRRPLINTPYQSSGWFDKQDIKVAGWFTILLTRNPAKDNKSCVTCEMNPFYFGTFRDVKRLAFSLVCQSVLLFFKLFISLCICCARAHALLLFLLFGQFKLFFLDCHCKKLVAIKVWRTRFSGLQDSVAKTKKESLDVLSGAVLPGRFRPVFGFFALLYSYEDKQISK